MKDIIIRSQALIVHVNAFGAELKGVEHGGVEYLWQGDAAYYSRTSPTLFPIIGRFLSDTYYVGEQDYQMPLNGIVTEANFTLFEQVENRAIFVLTDNERTRRMYPFSFALTVTYQVDGNRLTVRQRVENRSDVPLPFGLGCHTAYKWPLDPADAPEDCYLRFEQPEELCSFNPFGLELPFLDGTGIRPLSHELFRHYTRSLRNLRSQWVELRSRRHEHGVRIYRSEYPYLAIWSRPEPEAALICLEPCTSVHPGNRPSLHLEDRDGAQLLAPGEISDHAFSVEFF